jgi:hypothetical protein
LEKQARRYRGAVLAATPFLDQEILQDAEQVVMKQKQGLQIQRADNPSAAATASAMAMLMQQFRPEPSYIFWFDKDPPPTGSMNTLREEAVEIMSIDGLARDDVREMLLALLPDRVL